MFVLYSTIIAQNIFLFNFLSNLLDDAVGRRENPKELFFVTFTAFYSQSIAPQNVSCRRCLTNFVSFSLSLHRLEITSRIVSVLSCAILGRGTEPTRSYLSIIRVLSSLFIFSVSSCVAANERWQKPIRSCFEWRKLLSSSEPFIPFLFAYSRFEFCFYF